MAIPAPVPTPVTLPESLPPDHANSSFHTEMDIDVRDESAMVEARAGDGHVRGQGQGQGQGQGHEPAVKKVKRIHGEVEMVLRQTAEIVMVLVGVAALRGGNQPSPLECKLAAEAYEKLARIVTASAPQDLVSKDAVQSLIRQMTPPPPPLRVAKPVAIVRSQSPRRPAAAAATLASGPSRAPSPATARSKSAAAAQTPAKATTTSPLSSPLPSPAPTAPAAAVPLPWTPNVSAPPASSAQAPEPAAPATPSAPTSVAAVALQDAADIVAPTSSPTPRKAKAAPAVEDVQTSGAALDRAAPSATPAGAAPATTNTNIPATASTTPSTTPKPKPGRTSPVKQKSTPAADIATTNAPSPTTMTTMTTTTTATANPNSPPTTTTTTVLKDQRGNQAPKALARQRGLRNAGSSDPAVANSPDPQVTHQQLALAVHLLLKPQNITPGLPKGAVSGMSAPIPCGICKAVLSTINNVLVCDGCDGGFHLHCLQVSGSQLSVPKGDWYCVKCVTGNGGRPQAPKYGPLRRGPAGGCGPKNSWSMQAGCGSDSSKGQAPGKLVLQSRKKEGGAGDAVQGPVEAICGDARAAAALEASKQAEKRTKQAAACEQEAEPAKPAQIGAAGDDAAIGVKWVGPVVNMSQDKLFYSACSVGGETIRLEDTAFFRPETPNVPPYIARLQALWEEKSSGQKWVKVNWCYYPSDLPAKMGRPVITDPREIYESNHSDNNLVGSIQGPCLVLAPLQYQEEMERRAKNRTEDPMPLFLCQWFYDAPKGLFRAFS